MYRNHVAELIYRSAQSGEAEQIALLEDRAEAQRLAIPLGEAPESQKVLGIQRRLSQATTLSVLAVDKGEIAGFIFGYPLAEPPQNERLRFHIGAMAVLPECWGRRIGTTLVQQFVGAAERAGAQEINAWSAIDNEGIRRIDQRMGFVRTGNIRQRPYTGELQAESLLVIE